MSPGRPRQPVSEDRLTLKRLAAKLRQRKCREKKRASGKLTTRPKKDSSTNHAEAQAKGTSSGPSSPPCKTRIIHVPVPAYFGLPPYHHLPMYMPHPMSILPSRHHHHHHRSLDPRSHPGYTAHSYYRHDTYPMLPHRHPSAVPGVPQTAASTSAQSDTIPRTVSRSSSDVSADEAVSAEVPVNELNKKKRKKSLASKEKTAVDAILSLKSTSSDEDSTAETVSTTSSFIEDHPTIIQRVDNAQSVFRAVAV